MGYRAIIQFESSEDEVSDTAYVYEHWFSDKEFIRKIKKAIKRGYRRDVLASAYVAISAQEDLAMRRRHNRQSVEDGFVAKYTPPQHVTTVRIFANPEPWYDGLDVPSPIVVHSREYQTTTITYPDGREIVIP